MISSAQKIAYEPLRSLGHASISGTYAGVGTPFANPVRMLKVNNATDANLTISFDGVTDMDFIFANSAYVFDYATNAVDPVGQLEQPLGKRLYVKGSPSTGSVYVTVIYASIY